MYISVVIPIYNEFENIEILASKLIYSLNNIKKEYEIIFIDDGSTDESGLALSQLAQENSFIKLVQFTKNFGKTAAISAGFKKAKGEIIVTLDGDLQNDSDDIANLIAKIEEGYDAVGGWREKRQDNLWLNNIPSRIANKIISILTKIQIKDNGCFIKAFKSEFVKNLSLYGEMHRFIMLLAALDGAKITEIPVRHYPRQAGKSKYNISKTFQVILDIITVLFFKNFITKPLHMFGKLGFLYLLIAFIIGCIAVYKKVILGNNHILEHIITVCLFSVTGIQFITTGLLAEIIVRIYHRVQGQESYKIKKTIGSNKNFQL